MTAFFIIIASMVGIALSRAYVLTVLWAWFIMPAFSVPAIGLVTAFGIGFITVMLFAHPSTYQKPLADMDKDKALNLATDKLMESLIFPWVTLGSAWIILKIAALFA